MGSPERSGAIGGGAGVEPARVVTKSIAGARIGSSLRHAPEITQQAPVGAYRRGIDQQAPSIFGHRHRTSPFAMDRLDREIVLDFNLPGC
jgi:hypothetical protein